MGKLHVQVLRWSSFYDLYRMIQDLLGQPDVLRNMHLHNAYAQEPYRIRPNKRPSPLPFLFFLGPIPVYEFLLTCASGMAKSWHQLS